MEENYLKMLVEDIHSATVATIGIDGRPQTRIIDMMLWDEQGVYFLTAKGKAFFHQLMEQRFVAISATKGKRSISLRGSVRPIGGEKLEEIFETNVYMQAIYPEKTRDVLEVFHLYEAEGEYFDIDDPARIVRARIVVGEARAAEGGYAVTGECIGCKLCYAACPQKCIDIARIPVVIDQAHCLHCGRCAPVCPKRAIEKRARRFPA